MIVTPHARDATSSTARIGPAFPPQPCHAEDDREDGERFSFFRDLHAEITDRFAFDDTREAVWAAVYRAAALGLAMDEAKRRYLNARQSFKQHDGVDLLEETTLEQRMIAERDEATRVQNVLHSLATVRL